MEDGVEGRGIGGVRRGERERTVALSCESRFGTRFDLPSRPLCWRVSVVRVEFFPLGKKDPLPPPFRGEDSLLVVSTFHPSARPASSPVRVSPSSSSSPLFLHIGLVGRPCVSCGLH